jgi:hypothetical protein
MKQKLEKHLLPIPRAAGELFGSIHKAGSDRHSWLWLSANQVAAAAMNGAGAEIHLPAMKLAVSTAVLRVLDLARPGFRATHKHAEGGLYQVLGELKINIGPDKWEKGVRYRNEKGEEFARSKSYFNKRMVELK